MARLSPPETPRTAPTKVVVRTAEAGLHVAEHGVDPVEHRQLVRLPGADDNRSMGAADIGDTAKAGQAIGDDGARRTEIGAGPGGNRLAGESWQLGEFRAQWMAVLIHGDRADEGHLVVRATPGGAAGELAAEIGVVDLDIPAQLIAGLALHHGLHQLVVGLLQRRLALGLAGVALEELKQRHPRLKLDSIHSHGTHPLAEPDVSVRPSVAQPVSPSGRSLLIRCPHGRTEHERTVLAGGTG